MGPYVRTARCFDLDLIFELPYGPAAIFWPQQRPDRWLHPDYALNFSEKHLAPGRASTDGPQFRAHLMTLPMAGSRLNRRSLMPC